MAAFSRFLGAFATRDFWSFRVIHALSGAALTVAAAGGGLFVTERIKGDIAGLDQQIAFANQRYAAIDQALFQFRFAQTNAITFGVLSANDSLKPEFRKSMVDLMFVTRRMPTEIMMTEIYGADARAFAADRDAYLALIEKAKTATEQSDWDAVNAFEFDRESQLFAVQQKLLATIAGLEDTRRQKHDGLELSITTGFALQQIGFIIVLLAGLVHQHRERFPQPPPAPSGLPQQAGA